MSYFVFHVRGEHNERRCRARIRPNTASRGGAIETLEYRGGFAPHFCRQLFLLFLLLRRRRRCFLWSLLFAPLR